MLFAVIEVFVFFVGLERLIVATILAVILFAFVTVIFLVPVSTETLEAGTIEPTEYGDVPALVTTTIYSSSFADVVVALDNASPVPTVKAGESLPTNVWL